jgi:hypothetical protein
MTDVSVYYFVRHAGPGGRELLWSQIRSLEAKLRNQIRAEDSVGYWPPRPQIG